MRGLAVHFPSRLSFSGLFRIDILLVSLVMHLLALALPLALLQIYDRILPAQAYGTATVLVLGVAAAIVLESLLRYGRIALFASIGSHYEAFANLRMLDRLRHADLAEFEQRGTAAVVDAFRAIGAVRDFWSGQAGAALYELPFVVVYLGLIAYIGGWLVLVPLVLVLLAILAAWSGRRVIARMATAAEQIERERHDFLWGLFSALEYLKVSGQEGALRPRWSDLNARFHAVHSGLEIRLAWVRENAIAFGQVATVLLVAAGALAVMDGHLTTGALAACSMLAGRSIGPAMASLGFWSQLARVSEAHHRIEELLALPDRPALAGKVGGANVQSGVIAVQAPGLLAEPMLIRAGEVVHLATDDLVTASHFLMALAGQSRDEHLCIRIDGRMVEDYAQADFRDEVMLVSQHVALIPGTILDNLTLYDTSLQNEVMHYCELLGMQARLNGMRHGIRTAVGPGTAEHLDEGIAQRIALIRALVRKPKILLLDHAAKGLDLDGERRLAQLLQSMQGQTTVVMSTFRPALMAACNRSIALQQRQGKA